MQQQTAEHEVPLSTQAADAMPTSVKTSRGEDGAKESDDDVDEAEDNNDHNTIYYNGDNKHPKI